MTIQPMTITQTSVARPPIDSAFSDDTGAERWRAIACREQQAA